MLTWNLHHLFSLGGHVLEVFARALRDIAHGHQVGFVFVTMEADDDCITKMWYRRYTMDEITIREFGTLLLVFVLYNWSIQTSTSLLPISVCGVMITVCLSAKL